jgi:hypothetical protein
MKSVHNKSEQPKAVEWKFPCLGDYDGMIVLFTEHGKGTQLNHEGCNPIGCYSETWGMDFFTPLPCTESITLSND